MKAVLDTNIIISGLYSKRGASYQLLRAAISGELTFVISPLIAFEYEGKVYQKIEQGFLKISKEDCGLILDAFFAAAEIVWRPVQIRPILSDSSDDKNSQDPPPAYHWQHPNPNHPYRQICGMLGGPPMPLIAVVDG